MFTRSKKPRNLVNTQSRTLDMWMRYGEKMIPTVLGRGQRLPETTEGETTKVLTIVCKHDISKKKKKTMCNHVGQILVIDWICMCIALIIAFILPFLSVYLLYHFLSACDVLLNFLKINGIFVFVGPVHLPNLSHTSSRPVLHFVIFPPF